MSSINSSSSQNKLSVGNLGRADSVKKLGQAEKGGDVSASSFLTATKTNELTMKWFDLVISCSSSEEKSVGPNEVRLDFSKQLEKTDGRFKAHVTVLPAADSDSDTE